VSGIPHDKQRYSVGYDVTFGGGGATPGAAASGSEHDESAAQVAWEVALVRDAPKSGKVVARLQRGTSVRVGPVKDGWYPVKYGDGFANDGWVYRGALGK
jgi:hypothetical protein